MILKDACCEAPQPAEKTELQRALDALVAAEELAGWAADTVAAARESRAEAEKAVSAAEWVRGRLDGQVKWRQREVSRLSRQ